LQAGSIDNSGSYATDASGSLVRGLLAGGTLSLAVTGDVNSQNGAISASAVTFDIANALNNNGGLVQSSGDMIITAGSMDNSGTYSAADAAITKGLVSGGALNLTSTTGSINNSAGAI